MISLVIYGIIAISLASAAGFAFLTFTNTSKEVNYTQMNALRMDNAVAGVRAGMLALSPGANGGLLFPPMGSGVTDAQGGSYTGLPQSLGDINSSPWGAPYAYCPLSPTNNSGLATGGGNTVTQNVNVVSPPTANQYTVSTYNGPATSGVDYVIANGGLNAALTSLEGAGYVAFILSSQGPGVPVPTCKDITYNNSQLGVTGGIVRGVTAGLPYTQRAFASMDRLEIYVSSNSSGDATGRDTSNFATMDYAMNLWQSLQPRQTTIWVNNGPVTIDTSLNAEDTRPDSALGESPSLTFAAIAATPQVINLSYSQPYLFTTPITFENIWINLNNSITATKPLTFKTVTLNAATAGTALTLLGTTFMAENTTLVNIALQPTNSNVEFYNLSGTHLASTLSSTTINASASRLSFDGQVAGATYTFGTTASANLSAINSQVNIGPLATVTTLASSDSARLYASSLTVQGALNLTGQSIGGGLDAFSNSTVYVLPTSGGAGIITAAPSGGTMAYGVYLNGSIMGLEGTMSATNMGQAAIALRQSSLTSVAATGLIKLNGGAFPCATLLQGVSGMAPDVLGTGKSAPGTTPTNFPLYAKTQTQTSPDAVTFQQAQYGMPPFAGWQDNPPDGTLNSNNTSYFNYTTGRAPIVYNSVGLNGLNPTINPGSVIGYVDSVSLETAARNMLNAEYITGSSLSFSGTCQ